MEKLEEKVDVSSLEEEKKQLAGQLQQAQGSRKKLVQMLERLDPGDKHYDRSTRICRSGWIIFMTELQNWKKQLLMWRQRSGLHMENKSQGKRYTNFFWILIYYMVK